MGRELQKKKNRSGISKARPKPKSKKKILNNAIIAANWDKTQTLTQNYKRLGLTARLNKTTGGTEKNGTDVLALRAQQVGDVRHDVEEDPLVIGKKRKAEHIDVREAKIERDPATGRILRVIESATARANPLNDPLNDLESGSDEEPEAFEQHELNARPSRKDHERQGTQSEVMRKLEMEAAKPAFKYKPKQSGNERAFLAELVAKYGDDFAKMARDVKINYMQRSEGDLKQRIKKWREGGGTVDG